MNAAPGQRVSTFPDPTLYTWAAIAGGFESPVDIQFAPDGSGRMFVVEQPGRIRIFDPSGLARGPFLDLTDRVNSRGNEQGLLGLAFHPRYAENRLFYVNYTDDASHNVIARFRVSGDPDFADALTETRLLSIDDPFGNHNGGVLDFGPDGYANLPEFIEVDVTGLKVGEHLHLSDLIMPAGVDLVELHRGEGHDLAVAHIEPPRTGGEEVAAAAETPAAP